MLVALVLLALAAFAGAMLLQPDFATLPVIHLALAAGAMPLIAGAMLHFVPVLTRTPAPARGLRALPILLLVAGLTAFASFALPASTLAPRDAAAGVGIVAAAVLAAWTIQRVRRTLGTPHPGTWWYLAALLFLVLGLAAVLLMHAWPDQYLALRRFHLHLNTLGFIGITALGTLQVLLPTAIGRPDGGAARRLREDVRWVVAGTLLVAAGSAWQPLLVWPGLLAWLVPVLRLATAWWRLYWDNPKAWEGPGIALAGALVGLAAALALGAGHGAGLLPTAHASVAYVVVFLFPLVTGAAGYLLPLWVRPGVQTDWHRCTRYRLARFSTFRTALFLAAGALIGIWGNSWGTLTAMAGLAVFGLQLHALRTHRHPHDTSPAGTAAK